jgi:hypothetical protein
MYAEALFYRLQLSSSPTTNNKAVTTTAARTMTIQQQPDACSIADKPSFFLNSLLLSLSLSRFSLYSRFCLCVCVALDLSRLVFVVFIPTKTRRETLFFEKKTPSLSL